MQKDMACVVELTNRSIGQLLSQFNQPLFCGLLPIAAHDFGVELHVAAEFEHVTNPI